MLTCTFLVGDMIQCSQKQGLFEHSIGNHQKLIPDGPTKSDSSEGNGESNAVRGFYPALHGGGHLCFRHCVGLPVGTLDQVASGLADCLELLKK